MKKYSLFLILSVLGIAASFYAGTLFSALPETENQGGQIEEGESVRTTSGEYAFINPLLECEVNTLGARQKYIPFESKVKSDINEIIKKNQDIQISVYFRNLNNGPSFGINEKEKFFPASLMKVPVMMMYLKWAESDPWILEKSVIAQRLNETNQVYKPLKEVTIW